jgi:hypothetical protein
LAVIKRADELGTEILTFATRRTQAVRRKLGINIFVDATKKELLRIPEGVLACHGELTNDQVDALIIWHIAHNTKTEPGRPCAFEDLSEETSLKLALALRAQEWPADKCAEMVKYLPPADEAPEHFSYFFVTGKRKKTYCLNRVVPMIAAALDVANKRPVHNRPTYGTRADYDRAIGAYGNGHPSFLRSNFYWHQMHALVGTQKKPIEGADIKEEMRKLRRATRWVWYKVKVMVGKRELR